MYCIKGKKGILRKRRFLLIVGPVDYYAIQAGKKILKYF